MQPDGEELRCNCSANRLLGKVKQGSRFQYLEVVAHRSGRVLSQVRVYVGACEILCTSCQRTTRVNVKREGVQAQR